MMRRSPEVRDIGERDADVGLSGKFFQPPRPVERQVGVVPLDVVVLRRDLFDLEGGGVDGDAVDVRRLPKAVCLVERDGEVACAL